MASEGCLQRRLASITPASAAHSAGQGRACTGAYRHGRVLTRSCAGYTSLTHGPACAAACGWVSRAQVKACLRTHYPAIIHIFGWYSTVNSNLLGMSMLSYTQLVQTCEIQDQAACNTTVSRRATPLLRACTHAATVLWLTTVLHSDTSRTGP